MSKKKRKQIVRIKTIPVKVSNTIPLAPKFLSQEAAKLYSQEIHKNSNQ